MLKYILDKYKTQDVCDKAVDAYLPTLQTATHWFVTNKMLEKLDDIYWVMVI